MINAADIVTMDGELIEVPINDKFELSIYKIYMDNTLVFIDKNLNALLTADTKEMMGIPPEEDEDLTPEEILAKDVMYILTDNEFDKDEFVMMANYIKGGVVKYITVLDIVTKNINN